MEFPNISKSEALRMHDTVRNLLLHSEQRFAALDAFLMRLEPQMSLQRSLGENITCFQLRSNVHPFKITCGIPNSVSLISLMRLILLPCISHLSSLCSLSRLWFIAADATFTSLSHAMVRYRAPPLAALWIYVLMPHPRAIQPLKTHSSKGKSLMRLTYSIKHLIEMSG